MTSTDTYSLSFNKILGSIKIYTREMLHLSSKLLSTILNIILKNYIYHGFQRKRLKVKFQIKQMIGY